MIINPSAPASDKLTGQEGQVVGFDATGNPVAQDDLLTVKVLQTICENTVLTDSSPSITFSQQITLDSSAVYFLSYQHFFANGSPDAANSSDGFAKVDGSASDAFVRWMTVEENNSVTLTKTGVTDTWRESGKQAVVSIYKVEIIPKDRLKFCAGNREGIKTFASGLYSHAEGNRTIASGSSSHVEGRDSIASGSTSHAEGWASSAKNRSSHAEGMGTIAGDGYDGQDAACHAEGYQTKATGSGSHAEGDETTASGKGSHAEGSCTVASAPYSHAGGHGTIANGWAQTAIGRYNVKQNTAYSTDADKFIVGKGTSEDARANCFRVTETGVYATGAHNTTGADYAELFEWLDSNPDQADRCGRFVTLEGEKIRLAGPGDDFILGIVSGNPSVVGDVHDDQWQGMYLYDVFGRPLWEDVEVPDETIEEPDPENPESTVTRVIIPAHIEHRQKLNPAYDGSQPYLPRTQRPEWDAVGMLGKLVAVDDGTCQAGGWCTVGEDGAATHSAARTRYRVMARMDESHVRVLIL